MGFKRLRVTPFGIFDFAPALAVFGTEQVAQNGEKPSRHIRARLEQIDVGKRT